MDLIKLHGAENHYFGKRAVRIVSLVCAVLLSVLFSLAFALEFSVGNAVFKSDGVWSQIAYYTSLAVCLLICILTFVLIPKEKREEGTFPLENEYVSYYTLDNMFVKMYRVILALLICVQGVVFSTYYALSGNGRFTAVLLLLLSVGMALYFVPEITERLGNFGGKLHLVFGIFGMVWLLASVFVAYFDRTYPLASKYISLTEIGYIITLLALTYELRYRFDGTCIRARLAGMCSAFVFGFGFGVGRMIMLITVGQVNYGDTAHAVVMLALSVYFGIRVFFYSED